jgi:hypothetical protein
MEVGEQERLINDAIDRGFLVEICAGCGKPYTEADARKMGVKEVCNDCPAGSLLRWNPKLGIGH